MIDYFKTVVLAIAYSAAISVAPAHAAGADINTPTRAVIETVNFILVSAEKEVRIGNLRIENPWARATPGGAKVGGGYLVIHNDGSELDRLLAGATTIAGKVEIHEMAMVNDVMLMRRLENGIEIPAGGKVELKPGGYHVMFLQLKGPIVQGQPFDVELVFEKAGKLTLKFAVAPIGAKSFNGMAH